ncbi:MAG: DUF2269 family protein [Steroidobacteraceae bacterium]
MYLWMKLLHILGVVFFVGNITTGVFWHWHAERTRNPRLIAHAMEGVILSDRYFTVPGVVVIVASGVIAAINANFPLLGTPWILWGLILLSIAGLVFMFRLGPLQRQMHVHAQAGASSGSFDFDSYSRLAAQWKIWGAVATLAPLIALAFMVLKPAF